MECSTTITATNKQCFVKNENKKSYQCSKLVLNEWSYQNRSITCHKMTTIWDDKYSIKLFSFAEALGRLLWVVPQKISCRISSGVHTDCDNFEVTNSQTSQLIYQL